MNGELMHKKDTQLPTEKPTEDLQSESSQQDQELGSRTITWTLSCLDVKVDGKTFERLKTEIMWAEIGDDGSMTFRSTNADEVDNFSGKLRKIFAEDGEESTTKSVAFTLTPDLR